MMYYSLKLFHIVSAALFVASIAFSFRLWQRMTSPEEAFDTTQQIQAQTISFIIPLAILQLATGFTLISIKHYDFSAIWIMGSVIAFMIGIGSWLSFLYLLQVSQQQIIKGQQMSEQPNNHRYSFFRRVQWMMLLICAAAVVSMIFLMANKIT